jgi:hypothetical protein
MLSVGLKWIFSRTFTKLNLGGPRRVSDGNSKNGVTACTSCGSEKQKKFGSEIIIHFPGLKGLDKPTFFVFPMLAVCLDCGLTNFVLKETDLSPLRELSAE